MNLDWKIWTIIALTIFVILLILFQPPEPPDTTAWQDEIFRKELRQLTFLNKQDSTASAQKLAELRDSLAKEQKHSVKLSVSLAHYKAKPEVVKIVQENPIIDTVFQHYDSLLQSKDNQLAIQDSKILVLEDENNRIAENFLARLKLTEENYLNQKGISDSYKKENRKIRRANRLLKAGLVVFGVGGLIAGSQL